MDTTIVRLTQDTAHLLPHANQPFPVIGRLIPQYDGLSWRVTEALYGHATEKTYPDAPCDPNQYVDSANEAAFLALRGGERVGSLLVCRRWNGMAFIDDLKVDAKHRHAGIGRALIRAAVAWGHERGLSGLSLETQDTNLIACRFFMRCGFELCGIDTRAYTAPEHRGETALYFYLSDAAYKGQVSI